MGRICESREREGTSVRIPDDSLLPGDRNHRRSRCSLVLAKGRFGWFSEIYDCWLVPGARTHAQKRWKSNWPPTKSPEFPITPTTASSGSATPDQQQWRGRKQLSRRGTIGRPSLGERGRTKGRGNIISDGGTKRGQRLIEIGRELIV